VLQSVRPAAAGMRSALFPLVPPQATRGAHEAGTDITASIGLRGSHPYSQTLLEGI